MTLYIDIETYSRVDLKQSNVYRYVEDPDFQFLMAWYAIDDGDLQVALTAEEIYCIPGLWDDSVEKVAHNAPFERICFSQLGRGFYECEPDGFLSPWPWTDTMALAGEHGYPRKLEKLAQALGGELKDGAGTALINFFCKPNRKGERNLPEDHPEKWQQFLDYGRQDVVTLRDIHRKLKGWPNPAEKRAYMADQIINDTGLQVDVELAKVALTVSEKNRQQQEAEVTALTGVDNPGSNPQMMAWFRSVGFPMPNLQKETVEEKLAQAEDPTVRRVLELRQELALVAAKKYSAALNRVNHDGRLRGAFTFFGAHTGRWTSQGVQVQNLPSATIKPHDGHDDVDAAIGAAVVDLFMGADMDAHTMKALVRNMFTGPFTVVDYAAIEARVIAWVAGEEWALQAFRDGRDIYVETAERMGGMTRKEGKVAVLALGYNGGINSLRAMGAEGSDNQLQKLVYQWRDANENIVYLWKELEDAFKRGNGATAGNLRVESDGKDRMIVLPSGRAITYHNVGTRVQQTQYGAKRVITFDDPAFYPAKGTTYGGRLSENITQAIARDILSEALVRLVERGHKVVGHVHDEILVEGFSSVEDITKIMIEQPTWADGLPLSAEGFTCPRYRKD